MNRVSEHEHPCAMEGEFAPSKIGVLQLWPPVILAPMAGVTDVPFRSLCKSFMEEGLKSSGGEFSVNGFSPGFFFKQKITARGVVEKN